MQRRTFITASAATLGSLTSACSLSAESIEPAITSSTRPSFAVDGHRIRLFGPSIRKRVRLTVVADTHLFRDDARGVEYRQYSARMAAAYHQTQHFLTSKPTSPEESFQQILQSGQEQDIDLLLLVGDILSFPSEAAVDWVMQKLETAQLPFHYVAGNHDWHYEGMPGTLDELRSTWIEKRLLPLYQGRSPSMSFHDVGDVRILVIDNSTYEIQPDQLEFFRQHAQSGKPLLLVLHIPLYTPRRPVGFGCGHPDWGAKSDRNYEIERRPRWPLAGHTATTVQFHREVFASPQLWGIFAGHIHTPSIDSINGIPQFVADDNASGGFLDVTIEPA